MSKIIKEGDRVRLVTDRPWYKESGGGRVSTTAAIGPGDEGKVEMDWEDGDLSVNWDNGEYGVVAPECVELVTGKALPTLQGTLDVQIRFFVGDRDVTELLTGLAG